MPFLHTAERWCVPCRSLIAAMTQSVHGSDFRRVHGRDAQAHDLLESCTWRTNLHLHLLSHVWLHHLQVPRTVQLHHPDPIHCKPKDANRFERIRHSHRTDRSSALRQYRSQGSLLQRASSILQGSGIDYQRWSQNLAYRGHCVLRGGRKLSCRLVHQFIRA